MGIMHLGDKGEIYEKEMEHKSSDITHDSSFSDESNGGQRP